MYVFLQFYTLNSKLSSNQKKKNIITSVDTDIGIFDVQIMTQPKI